jgi:hypothetical protein
MQLSVENQLKIIIAMFKIFSNNNDKDRQIIVKMITTENMVKS